MPQESARAAAIAVQDEIRVSHIATRDAVPVLDSQDGEALRRELSERGYDQTLVRDCDGVVSTFVLRERLGRGAVADFAQRIEVSQVTHETTPVLDIVPSIVRNGFLFVAERRGVRGIVTAADLQKVPVRIALFGLTTSFELVAREAIVRHLGDRDPLQFLSEKRRQDALGLLEKRRRRKQDLAMIECLQLCDLGTLAAKLDLHTVVFGRPSKSALEPEFTRVETLRNHLAHASDLELDELPGAIDSLHDLLRFASRSAA